MKGGTISVLRVQEGNFIFLPRVSYRKDQNIKQKYAEDKMIQERLTEIAGHIPHGTYSFHFALPLTRICIPSYELKIGKEQSYSCKYYIESALHLPGYDDLIMRKPINLMAPLQTAQDDSQWIRLESKSFAPGDTIKVHLTQDFDEAEINVIKAFNFKLIEEIDMIETEIQSVILSKITTKDNEFDIQVPASAHLNISSDFCNISHRLEVNMKQLKGSTIINQRIYIYD